MAHPLIRMSGDSAAVIEFSAIADVAVNNAVLAFEAHMRSAVSRGDLTGVTETAPTIRSVTARFDPLVLPPGELRARLTDMLNGRDWFKAPPPAGRRLWRIPAVYGGACGPFLPEVADLLGLSEAAAAEAHAAQRLRVMMLGFAPGLCYLGLSAPEWGFARRAEITPQIPPGSIAVAVRQTVMCATPIPTGWRTIARTAFLNFRPASTDPFPIGPGDEITFEPAARLDFDHPLSLTSEPLGAS